jgi:phage/plasmid-associated DNA primase
MLVTSQCSTVFYNLNCIPNIKKWDNGMIRRLKIIRYPFNFAESDKLVRDKTNWLRDDNLKDSSTEDEELKQTFIHLY